MDLDTVASGEAGINAGVRREYGDAILHGRAGDGAADGRAVGAGLLFPDVFRQQLAILPAQQDETALAWNLGRHQAHHGFQQFRKIRGPEQGSRHGSQALEKGRRAAGILIGLVLREHLFQRRVGHHDGARSIKGPVLQGDAGSDAFGRCEGIQRIHGVGASAGGTDLGAARVARWRGFRVSHPLHGHFAHQDGVPLFEGRGAIHQNTVHDGSIQGTQIHHVRLAIQQKESGMNAAHPSGHDADGGRVTTTDGDPFLGQIDRVPDALHQQRNFHDPAQKTGPKSSTAARRASVGPRIFRRKISVPALS